MPHVPHIQQQLKQHTARLESLAHAIQLLPSNDPRHPILCSVLKTEIENMEDHLLDLLDSAMRDKSN
ncbi:hypothetical protein D9M71_746770 [compost metagenome]|uniref:hypothetical protein n=1 Tax=Pseudomonas sp. D(2018) TaxID=2502238 RepID=UPI00048A6A26|nr:hypothetical protein [Pseudomonas sp. D(2018)]